MGPFAETAFHVADLWVAREFYRRVFGLDVVFEDREAVGFQLSGGAVLMLFGTNEPLGGGTHHLRLEISPGTLDDWDRHLMVCGVAVESRVRSDSGEVSLFFRDPDSHALELACPPG